jgi:hypothetical protein
MVTLSSPPYTIQLREGFPRAITPSRPDAELILLDDIPAEPTSCHRIEVLQESQLVAQVQLQTSKGETGVHDQSAVVADDTLFIACGASVTALQLQDLQLMWTTQVDELTCFGVHHNPIHHCLITHGELAIARINFDGSLVWQAVGESPFTGPLEAQGESVIVTDDAGQEHVFEVSTGATATRAPV